MGWDAAMAFRDCPWCGLTHAQMNPVTVNHQVFAAADGRHRFWSVVFCPGCASPILLETAGPQLQDGRIHTEVPTGQETIVRVQHLPEDVDAYYSDAIRVLRAGVPDAAAVQLRRTLEAAAAHFNVEEKVLVKSIQRLIDDGHVTKSFGQVLHYVRVVGNQGAHASDDRLGHDTVSQALNFTTQLLRNLFEVPEELKQLAVGQADDDNRDA